MLPFFKEQFCEGMIFLHLKKQWFYWLLPLFVIYLLIVPSQSQILAEGAADLSKIIDVFDSAKIYLLLFAVWNMYLAMKLFLRKDTREVTYSLPWINKGVWCIIFQIFYLLLTLPYLIWLWNGTKAAGYEKNAAVLIFQIVIISCFSFLCSAISRSALGGLAIGCGYILLNVGVKSIPDCVNLMRLGELEAFFTFDWYIIQIIWGAASLLGGAILEKKKYFI